MSASPKGIAGLAIQDKDAPGGKYQKDFTARATIGEVVQISDRAAKHYADEAKWLAVCALAIAVVALVAVVVVMVVKA
jgi:hypothetical protein